MDFVMGSLANTRRLKCLTVADDFIHESVDITVDHGKFRDECLNGHWFETLAQARAEFATWRRDYSEVRPHSSCNRWHGYMGQGILTARSEAGARPLIPSMSNPQPYCELFRFAAP
jgi:transposase InsO family protein